MKRRDQRFAVYHPGGLTKLRQLSNHPKMIDPGYTGDSGKLNDVAHMIEKCPY